MPEFIKVYCGPSQQPRTLTFFILFAFSYSKHWSYCIINVSWPSQTLTIYRSRNKEGLPMGVRTGSAESTTPWDTFTSEGWISVGPSTIWMICTSCSRRPEAGLRPAEGDGPPGPLLLVLLVVVVAPPTASAAVITQQQQPSPIIQRHSTITTCTITYDLATAFIIIIPEPMFFMVISM